MTISYTTHFRFGLPDFLSGPWHADWYTLVRRMDEVLYEIALSTIMQVWTNSTSYTPGNVRIDPNLGTIWTCLVAHTSVASPTTFATDRSNHPTFWGVFPGAVTLADGNYGGIIVSAGGTIVTLVGIRERLLANRTYFVRTDGNDANSGLANNAGGAFLTIQKAFDVTINNIDLNGFDVTIQLGSGTYAGNAIVKGPCIGAGRVTLSGDTTTPSNCLITGLLTIGVMGNKTGAALAIQGTKHVVTGTAISLLDGARLSISGKMEFGICTGGNHISLARTCGLVIETTSYTISGGGLTHIQIGQNSVINKSTAIGLCTVTLTGTPNFSTAFINGSLCSTINLNPGLVAFSGAATGKRYAITTGAIINTAGSGVNYFPGDVAGTPVPPATDNGAYYV